MRNIAGRPAANNNNAARKCPKIEKVLRLYVEEQVRHLRWVAVLPLMAVTRTHLLLVDRIGKLPHQSDTLQAVYRLNAVVGRPLLWSVADSVKRFLPFWPHLARKACVRPRGERHELPQPLVAGQVRQLFATRFLAVRPLAVLRLAWRRLLYQLV